MSTKSPSTIDDHEARVSTQYARILLDREIQESIANAKNTLINAPTGLGKSYTIATSPWRDWPDVTGGEPVVHLSQTKKARDEAAKHSDGAGLEYKVFKGREDMCPVAAGEHDDRLTAPDGKNPSEWFDQKCDVERLSFSFAHRKLAEDHGGLPCMDDEPCEAVTQWEQGLRAEDGSPRYDIVHATADLAYVPKLHEGTNVVFDEQPSYRTDLDQEQYRRALNELLKRRSDGRYMWAELVHAVRHKKREQLDEYYELVEEDTGWGSHFEASNAHWDTAAITRAIATAKEAGNDRYQGQDGLLTVVLDDKNDMVVHQPPNLSQTRCVIGLDAHPSELLWELNTVPDIQEVEILTPDQRQDWRVHERGLRVIQVGDDTRPYTTGWYKESVKQKAKAIIRKLRDEYGDQFRTCISPIRIESDVQRMMEDVGIDDYETLHYGEQKSRNDFAGEPVGLLAGSIDPGDSWILDTLSLCGLNAEPESDESQESGRALGRGFVGPDADAAREFLESVRRTNVAQSVGRYARNAGDSDSEAVVYVWTNVLPENMVDEQVSGATSLITNTKQEIEEFVREQDCPVTKTEVAEETGVSRKYAWETLKEMAIQGVVTRSEGTGKDGADEYESGSGDFLPSVDLGL